jgi:uncharacterized protein (TIGR03435 family)
MPDGFSAGSITLDTLVFGAYAWQWGEVTGGPPWFSKDEYAVELKFAPEVADAFNKLNQVDRELAKEHAFRVFLKERTNLAIHITQKEVDGFDLVIGKKGTTLTPAADPNAPDHGLSFRNDGPDMTSFIGKAVPISAISGELSGMVGAPITDKTGLTGVYNFTARYKNEPSGLGALNPQTERNAAAQEIEEQLGLTLVPARVTVNSVHIDHIDRPSEE